MILITVCSKIYINEKIQGVIMSAYTGVIKENSISLGKIDLKKYDGKKVLVIIDSDNNINDNKGIDLTQFILPKTSDRAIDVELYMGEMRNNDRI